MQFMPATWRAYGLGGDVHDRDDAILGAANYLRASGAARDLRAALYAYNHSDRYVDAVATFAAQMRRDISDSSSPTTPGRSSSRRRPGRAGSPGPRRVRRRRELAAHRCAHGRAS